MEYLDADPFVLFGIDDPLTQQVQGEFAQQLWGFCPDKHDLRYGSLTVLPLTVRKFDQLGGLDAWFWEFTCFLKPKGALSTLQAAQRGTPTPPPSKTLGKTTQNDGGGASTEHPEQPFGTLGLISPFEFLGSFIIKKGPLPLFGWESVGS